MEFSKKQIDEAMAQYLQDNEDYGDYNESELINEVFKGVKSLLIENTSDRVSVKILQEHANTLDSISKDILEDFVLYINMDELDNLLT
jgi:hypothetical protein